MSATQKTLRVVLDIDVRAFTAEEIADCGLGDLGEDEGEDEGLSEYASREIAELLPFAIEQFQDEMFAGSNVFAKLTKVKVASSEWGAE